MAKYCVYDYLDDMLFLGVIYIEHLVFYRLFQLINSSNRPIPVYSYQYNQYDMYTSVHVNVKRGITCATFFCWISMKHEYK